MAIIFNEKGVRDCKPCSVAQTFINHNAILYKIYCVGEEYFVVERPSLKNFYSNGKHNFNLAEQFDPILFDCFTIFVTKKLTIFMTDKTYMQFKVSAHSNF